MEEHVEADPIDLEDSKVQWDAIKMSKKRTEEVSIKLSPSKVDMQTNIDNEQPIFATFHVSVDKRGYDFSNPMKLEELRDEVTDEKIHGLTKSQM
ncbi:hypothetical protein H5410_002220 [Solanum commersonii]|uniref:Uncharacterized protein n=1 Tax=Solanum commersonii TaxID=4109 RepID=A0A9J6B298_SOLCO|nr:hypothetical protein H5410_002220 [Solanum commersonii]